MYKIFEQTPHQRKYPCMYCQLIFDKGIKNTQGDKNSIFNKLFRKNWISTGRKIKLDSYFIPYVKIN